MSFAVRNAFRTAGRAAPRRARGYATEQPQAVQNYLAEEKALKHHAAEASDLWRKISYYVCIPGIAVCVAWVYNAEVEHAAHIEHMKHENGGELPEVPAYDFLNRRGKPFPWGNNTLFWNAAVNKDMEA